MRGLHVSDRVGPGVYRLFAALRQMLLTLRPKVALARHLRVMEACPRLRPGVGRLLLLLLEIQILVLLTVIYIPLRPRCAPTLVCASMFRSYLALGGRPE